VTVLVTLLLVTAGILAARARVTRRAEAAVAVRLTIQANGMVAGASPIDLPRDGTRAVLMLHGFGDTPQTLHYLATYMHAQGWSVRVPLLPGHGRTLDRFAASRATEWVTAARGELASLSARYATVSIIGQSMGGALATILAAESSHVRAIVLLAPYLSMPTRLRRAANVHRLLGVILPYLRGGGERSIRDPAEQSRNLAYGYTTPRLVSELARVVALGRAAAPAVAVPTLVIQSRQDNRIPPDAAERAFALFTAAERRLLWTEGNGHVISVDYGRDAVFAATADWLAAHAEASQPVADPPRLRQSLS
jgi:carboxylesterase